MSDSFCFFGSCLEEMKQAARSLGKTDLRMINKHNPVALDPMYAEMAGVTYAGNYFRGEFEE